jgi:Na+:H+ antiporter, NhaB family
MTSARLQAFATNFLGRAPEWYKGAIVAFLILNPLVYFVVAAPAGPFIAGWMLVLEFIFTLAMALRCYPLQPGGLLAAEAIVMGMASPGAVYEESLRNFPVIMLLMFMVAGIYFLRGLLLFIFTKLVLGVRSKVMLSLLFCFVAALLSAFLDALTVTAVVITVGMGLYGVFHKVASGKQAHDGGHDQGNDDHVDELCRADLDQFRAFLRQLLMHAAVGTALGGVATLVGEPQNLLIGEVMGWHFVDFFLRVAPVSIPVLVVGLLTCGVVERLGWFGYGAPLPQAVRAAIEDYARAEDERRSDRDRAALLVQGIVVALLVLALGFHVAEVGVIGLLVIVLTTAFVGIIEEHRIAHAFEEALPFTALLVVFFAVVAVIHEQGLFEPVIHWVLAQPLAQQAPLFFVANGVLSMVSDNVFVATVYITSVQQAFQDGLISREHFEALAVAINTGTNIPSVATPNGQAAFLFLLTSAIAPLIRLSYARMVWLALPYTVALSLAGLAAVILAL